MNQIPCTNCQATLNVNDAATETGLLQCAMCGQNVRLGPSNVRYSKLAITSLLLGFLSFGCTLIAGIPAIICGGLALQRTKESGGSLKGRGLAVSGVILGFVGSAAIFLLSLQGVKLLRDSQNSPPIRVNGNQLPTAAVQLDYSNYHVLVEPNPEANYFWLHPTNGLDPAQDDPSFNETFATAEYDDSMWVADPDEGGFGYGDPFGTFIGKPEEGYRCTAYFRRPFNSTTLHESLVLEFKVDDGAIIYIDGERVAEVRMSNAKESYQAFASTNRNEDDIEYVTISKKLEPGEHILAISVHNTSPTSSDLGIAHIKLYGEPEADTKPIGDAAVDSDLAEAEETPEQ